MKHAYLIVAHNEFGILKKLLQQLDDVNSDLFIHLDKKVKQPDFEALKKCCHSSKIYFVKRMNVQWGGR